MDDAMILPCGHSFGSGGIQHVLRVVSYWQEHCSSILLNSFISCYLSFFRSCSNISGALNCSVSSILMLCMDCFASIETSERFKVAI